MDFDIVIVGGGMVGASLAAALQKKNYRIALIDSTPLKISEDERLIALNDNSICFFEKLGIWPSLQPHAAPISEIHVSHQGHFGSARLHASDANLSALGYVVPAKYINLALNNFLQEIEMIRPATLQNLLQDERGVQLEIQEAGERKTISAKWVIGADGSYSTVRKLLEIPVEEIDYQQSALVTVTELTRHHKNIAYERFIGGGALAMLPLPGNNVATIWTDDTHRIAELLKMGEEDFLALVQNEFGYRLGRLKKIGKRACYPLRMIKAKQAKKQNVLLIGNALHTVHPIAAQGLNLALYEIAHLAENISLLELPDCHVQAFNIDLAHRLKGFFSKDSFFLNRAREAGLIALDLFPLLKKQFTQRASGKSFRLPGLLTRTDE